MSNIINNQLLDTINETIDRASDLGESWLGTTTGRILDSERDQLRSVVKANDLELASVMVLNLAQTCEYAEKALNEY